MLCHKHYKQMVFLRCASVDGDLARLGQRTSCHRIRMHVGKVGYLPFLKVARKTKLLAVVSILQIHLPVLYRLYKNFSMIIK